MEIVEPFQKKRHFLMQVPLDILERGLTSVFVMKWQRWELREMKAALERTSVETKTDECLKKIFMLA